MKFCKSKEEWFLTQWTKITEKAVCRSVFLTIWDGFFGDFVHWVRVRYPCIPGSIRCLPFIVKTQKWCKYISQHLKRGDSDLSLKFTCFEIKGSWVRHYCLIIYLSILFCWIATCYPTQARKPNRKHKWKKRLWIQSSTR